MADEARGDDVDGLTRVDRRKLRTRQQLVAAAEHLIREEGVLALRVADITERADVGRGSFYSHFDSKEDIVEEVVRTVLGDLTRSLAVFTPDDDDIALAAATADRRFIRIAYEDVSFVQLLLSLQEADRLFERVTHPFVQQMLEQGVANGRFTVPDMDLTIAYLAGGGVATWRLILAGELGPDADVAHAELVLRMLGIAADEAARIARLPLPEAQVN